MALNPFDELESSLTPALDPRVFVEPKDKGKQSESKRQGEWVNHMHKHARKVLVFAIPNGTHIPSFAGRARIKAEGLYTGFPDTGALFGKTLDPLNQQPQFISGDICNIAHLSFLRC